MDDSSSSAILLICLLFLVIFSAFFSSSETAMMALNRYRLRHLVKKGNKGAIRAANLLARPDRLIGGILIGNNIANILATSIATALAIQLWGDKGIAITTVILTLVILIFAEVTPKTFAALNPERVAFPASVLLVPLQKLFYPFVLLINGISNALLRPFGVRPEQAKETALNAEELRTVVHDSGEVLPLKRRGMLLGVLDLETVTVNDIMIPRNEIKGIDIEDGIKPILDQVRTIQHTRIPIYRDNINNIIGMLHMRNIGHLLSLPNITKSEILKQCDQPYFIPESTPLHTQLLQFQKTRQRVALVVDEYGDMQGLVTLEDILEEIVGEFTTDTDDDMEIQALPNGSFIVDATLTIREINKTLNWNLPTNGPKTLNGLITEVLEDIPEAPACLKVGDFVVEIVDISNNIVLSAKLIPIASLK